MIGEFAVAMCAHIYAYTRYNIPEYYCTLYRYAGVMSREDAGSLLQLRPNGTFLIRHSVNPQRRGELALSVK